jgi:tetratricopeptide (TPR) repeat protein
LNLFLLPREHSACLVALIVVATCVFPVSSLAVPQAGDAQAAFNLALELLQSGKTADALAVIDSAIKDGARDPSLYNLKGLAAGELGRDQEAEDSFRTVIKLAPKVAMGYNNLGVLLSKLGRDQEATSAFREAHEKEPQNFNALLGLGTSLAALRKYDEAASYLQKAWDVRPGDFQAGYEWAHALLGAQQLAAAKRVLNQVAVPQESELAVKYYSLAGVVAEGMNEYVAASEFYRQAYALNPGSYDIYLALVRATLSSDASPGKEALPAPPESLSASQNLALALLFASRNALQPAIQRFEATLRLDPSNEDATLNLALAEKATGKSSEAVDRLRRAVASRPSAELYSALGGMEEDSGQYVQALQSYQRAVELDPSSEQYYFDLGVEYLTHFTFGPAAEVYRVGTRKFPQSSRQYVGLGFSHYAVREYREAADAFTTALEIDPDSPAVFRAWNSVLDSLAPNDWEALLPRLDRLAAAHGESADLAFCHGAALFRSEFAKGQNAALDRSQAALDKAVRLRPDFPAAHLELGALYVAKKLNQKAVDEYLEVIREDPKSEVAHYRLGQLYREMNQLELATTELTRYQELAHLHQEELKRNRSTIKQFIIPQTAKPNN